MERQNQAQEHDAQGDAGEANLAQRDSGGAANGNSCSTAAVAALRNLDAKTEMDEGREGRGGGAGGGGGRETDKTTLDPKDIWEFSWFSASRGAAGASQYVDAGRITQYIEGLSEEERDRQEACARFHYVDMMQLYRCICMWCIYTHTHTHINTHTRTHTHTHT